MALWQLDAFTAPVFLGFVRAAFEADPPTYQGSRWAPFETQDDLAFEYILGANRRQAMATVLAWDSEAPIAQRAGVGERVFGELPPIKRKSRISEKEIIRFNKPRQGTRDVQAAIEAVYQDTLDLIAAVRSRVEWMTVQALAENLLVYDEDGIKFSFDYSPQGIFQWNIPGNTDNGSRDPGGSNAAIGVGAAWNLPATATYISDLVKICDLIQLRTGTRPTELVMSLQARNYMFQSTEIKNLVRGTAAGTTTIQLTPPEVQQVFDIYNLPTITTYDVTVTKENKDGSLTDVRPLAVNKAFLTQGRPVGRFALGPTAESRALPYSLQGAAPGIWANTYATDEPPAEWTKVAMVGFPTLPEMNRVGQLTLW